MQSPTLCHMVQTVKVSYTPENDGEGLAAICGLSLSDIGRFEQKWTLILSEANCPHCHLLILETLHPCQLSQDKT